MNFAAPIQPARPAPPIQHGVEPRKRSPRHRPRRISPRQSAGAKTSTTSATPLTSSSTVPTITPIRPSSLSPSNNGASLPTYASHNFASKEEDSAEEEEEEEQEEEKEEKEDDDEDEAHWSSLNTKGSPPLPVSLRPLQGVRAGPLPTRPPPKKNRSPPMGTITNGTSVTSHKSSPLSKPLSSDQLGPVHLRLEHKEGDGLTTISTLFDLGARHSGGHSNHNNHSDTSSNDSLSPTGNLRPIQGNYRSPSISPTTGSKNTSFRSPSPGSIGSVGSVGSIGSIGSSIESKLAGSRSNSPSILTSLSSLSSLSTSALSSPSMTTIAALPPSPSPSPSSSSSSSMSTLSSKFDQLPQMPVEDLNSSIGSVYSRHGVKHGGRRRNNASSTPPSRTTPSNPRNPMGVHPRSASSFSSGRRYDGGRDRLEESWPPQRRRSPPSSSSSSSSSSTVTSASQALEDVGGRLRQFDRHTNQAPVGFGARNTEVPRRKASAQGGSHHNGGSSKSNLDSLVDIRGHQKGTASSSSNRSRLLFSNKDATYTALDDLQ